MGVVDKQGQDPTRVHPMGAVMDDVLAPAPWITRVLSTKFPPGGSSDSKLLVGVEPVPAPFSPIGKGSGARVGVGVAINVHVEVGVDVGVYVAVGVGVIIIGVRIGVRVAVGVGARRVPTPCSLTFNGLLPPESVTVNVSFLVPALCG